MLNQLVVFTLDAQRFALSLESVQRVLRMVEVTPVPKAPEVVLGVIDLEGSIVPVMSMRKRFGRPELATSLSDELIIITQTAKRNVALVVDSVTGVIERTVEEITEAEKIVPKTQYVEGIIGLEDGILFIHNVERFLSKKEDEELEGLLKQAAGRA